MTYDEFYKKVNDALDSKGYSSFLESPTKGIEFIKWYLDNNSDNICGNPPSRLDVFSYLSDRTYPSDMPFGVAAKIIKHFDTKDGGSERYLVSHTELFYYLISTNCYNCVALAAIYFVGASIITANDMIDCILEFYKQCENPSCNETPNSNKNLHGIIDLLNKKIEDEELKKELLCLIIDCKKQS